MATKTCPTCRKTFPALLSRGRKPTYCSETCRREMNNRRRRLRRGSIPRAGRPEKASPGRRTTTRTAAPTSPDGWAKWVRDRYELDASEDQLLELAVDSLKLSRDEGQDPKVRLTAMGRYQALLRQLGLEAAEEEHGTSQNVVRFAGRR